MEDGRWMEGVLGSDQEPTVVPLGWSAVVSANHVASMAQLQHTVADGAAKPASAL